MYELGPLRERLAEAIDFDALNDGAVRVTVTATDAASGERVVFDTREGVRLTVEHVLAASAFLPLFPPVEIGGRLLLDGGLVANLPVDVVLDQPDGPDACVAVDLFAPEGEAPRGLASALSRVADLMFGNQSRLLIESARREQALRAAIGRLGERLPAAERDDPAVTADLAEGRQGFTKVIAVRYRAGPDEAGPEKGFDFSGRSLAARWAAGAAAMAAAMPDG